MEQVEANHLQQYLVSMRIKGYKIIGIEQTSQSKCLTKYKFPKKYCLVLGNERTGIPADLINIMDECIEIPQFGIIRSLNVHVSGSIVLWEAKKQEIDASK